MEQQKTKTKRKPQIVIALAVLGFVIAVLAIAFSNPFGKKVITGKSQQSDDLGFRAEYERTAQRVLIMIADQEYQDDNSNLLSETYGQLLANFPSYTEFIIMVSPENLPKINAVLSELDLENRANIITIGSSDVPLDAWAQDYFEPADKNGSTVLLISDARTDQQQPGRYSDFMQRIETRNSITMEMKASYSIRTMPFVFEGGNIIIGKSIRNEPLALVDYSVILDSLPYSPTDEIPSKDILGIAGLISENFAGTEVAVLGNAPRDGNFVHLDQSVLLLPNQVALVNEISGSPFDNAVRQHRMYQKQLGELGFEILTIDTTPDDLQASRSSLNAIPFFDRSSGKTKVIFPVFENELKKGSSEGKLPKSMLSGKALQTFEALEKNDVEPIPLLDRKLHQNRAGFHCIVNVLE